MRRRRYSGTNPRQFEERYKELDPDRYAGDVAKVLASGRTPAGIHRPIMVTEVLEALTPSPGEFAVDLTLGYGGHAQSLQTAVQPGGRLLALDVDPYELPRAEARLRALDLSADALIVRRSNFAGLASALAAESLPPADVVLADLGVSSMQIDNPARGFTFKRAGPLDLRMNPRRGQPASALLATLDAESLASLLETNADEPHAQELAHALIARQRIDPITTTVELAEAVRHALPPAGKGWHDEDDSNLPVRRVFQALRVAVNDEFGALDALLRQLPDCVAPGGRIAFLTFHSGEDRRVKQAFKDGERRGLYSRISAGVIRATTQERYANPRASSAKLRWAVRS